MPKKNVLASASPRRKLILENVGLHFDVVPSTFEENVDKTKFPLPEDYVLETARLKLQEVALKLSKTELPPHLIIGADTVVSQDNRIIEKPKDKDDAFHILKELSGTSHKVMTGVILAVPYSSKVLPSANSLLNGQFRYTTFVQTTDVFLYELTDEVIQSYIDTGEPMDKAGGYGIQGIGGTFIEKIHGDYFNVMGFPLSRFAKELSKIYAHIK